MYSCVCATGHIKDPVPLINTGLTKFDWKVVAQWATKDSTLVAQQ